jgi:hypothetical protein
MLKVKKKVGILLELAEQWGNKILKIVLQSQWLIDHHKQSINFISKMGLKLLVKE